uniref:Uncharacterized protein n=1 Tax=Romanomermis culicivorax TaxID=13658 RepID=A0A915KB26_ROMCU
MLHKDPKHCKIGYFMAQKKARLPRPRDSKKRDDNDATEFINNRVEKRYPLETTTSAAAADFCAVADGEALLIGEFFDSIRHGTLSIETLFRCNCCCSKAAQEIDDERDGLHAAWWPFGETAVTPPLFSVFFPLDKIETKGELPVEGVTDDDGVDNFLTTISFICRSTWLRNSPASFIYVNLDGFDRER